jgi:mono/diheme cytochrome c family protein
MRFAQAFSRIAVIRRNALSVHAFLAIVMIDVAMCGRATAGEPSDATADAKAHFVQKVAPLFASRCLACHGADNAEAGLRLDSRQAALKGGDTGPSLVPGKPEKSLLLLAVKQTHAELKMPPKDKLAAHEIAALERWIRDGAPWPSAATVTKTSTPTSGERTGDAWSDPRNPIVRIFGGKRLDLWSLQPVERPELPAVKHAGWVKNDLDRFVLADYERDEIPLPAAADSRTLARRLSFDLTGLPPTHEQVADFAQSVEREGIDRALEVLVDRLLASPRYGEHLARMWLDVVRYSDSNGFDWDEFRPQAWRFRDYVVRSFNADKPFDTFIVEQLAGDELCAGPPRTPAEQDRLIATGYLRLGPHDNAAGLFNEQDRSRAELLSDLTETTGGAFLGLTFSCCRCHDHKYDPVSQADHYRLRAFFAAVKFADDLPLDLESEQQAIREHNAPLDEQISSLRAELAKLPESDKVPREKIKRQIDAMEAQRRSFTRGLLMTDNREGVPATHVLFQGDHKAPRQAVEPGFLSVFDPQPAALVDAPNPGTTGRRLTLARWIASSHNPLTARVLVNRIWQNLMGRALVETPNDFGLAGSPPHDAALLDWLTSEFMAQGWSIKKLVRQIVASATYRQQATYDRDYFSLRLPRRLTAEQLRDAVLSVSGLLTSKCGGPPIWPELPPEVLQTNPAFLDDNAEKTKGWYPSTKADQYCRGLFLVQKRTTHLPLLEAFDLPDNSTPCARRETSTVAPQALMLLNNALVADAAHALAERVKHGAGDAAARQVQRTFELTLQRSPDETEMAVCRRLIDEHGLASLCRALLNVNEFVYLD